MLLEPEMHVVALFQPALAMADDRAIATVQSVTLVPRGSGDPADVIKPTRTVELSEDYQKLIGIKADRGGVLAVFPSASLTPGVEIRVVFDRIARAPSPACMCRECVIQLEHCTNSLTERLVLSDWVAACHSCRAFRDSRGQNSLIRPGRASAPKLCHSPTTLVPGAFYLPNGRRESRRGLENER